MLWVHLVSRFQFHKGAIRTVFEMNPGDTISYFNSIKVRLEQSVVNLNLGHATFQFHKGAIRTRQSFDKLNDFQKNFNSIKVRLEQLEATINKLVKEFQFHKGAIRTFSFVEHSSK